MPGRRLLPALLVLAAACAGGDSPSDAPPSEPAASPSTADSAAPPHASPAPGASDTPPASAGAAGAPRFEEFAVSDTFAGPPAAPDLSDPDAARFRTAIVEGAKRGPNFAGGFTIVEWGCGTECQEFVIVDARTGTVYLDTPTLALGAAYRRDSRLLVVNPPERLAGLPAEVRDRAPTAYYVWEDGVLAPLSVAP